MESFPKNTIQKSLSYLLIPIIAWLIFVLICSPLREAVIDDDFSTVWEVKNYLASGQYQQGQWTAPFTLFQVIYGAGIAKILEDFLPIEASLRISNLFFSLIGIISLFFLARQSGLNLKASSICAMQMVAASIYTYTSYLFYSDIPSLAMALVSILFYSQGLSKNKPFLVLFASLCASASILLRQTGITILIALAAYFILLKNKKYPLITGLLALMIPLISLFYLTNFQLSSSTFGSLLANRLQSIYLHSPMTIILSSFERLSLLPIMMTLLSVPLSCIGFIYIISHYYSLLIKNKKLPKKQTSYLSWLLFSSALLLLAVIFIRLFNQKSWELPYLLWYYSYNSLANLSNSVFSLIVLLSSALLVFAFFLKYRKNNLSLSFLKVNRLRNLSLLDWFTLSNLILLLLIYKVGDKYFLVLLPWFLIWLCSFLSRYIKKYFIIIIFILTLVIIGNAAVLDKAYLITEAELKAVKILEASSGVSSKNIWYPMAGFYRFDDYVKEVGFPPPNFDFNKAIVDDIYDYLYRWVPEQQKRSLYHIFTVPFNSSYRQEVGEGEIINKLEVKDWIGHRYLILTVKSNTDKN